MQSAACIISVLLCLSGCAAERAVAARRMPLTSIDWVIGSKTEIAAECLALTGNPRAVACARVEPGRCTIYARQFRHDRDDDAFAEIGEELAHCFFGDFHKEMHQ